MPDPTPNPEQREQPTVQDATAIATAAGDAVNPEQTPDQARQAAADAVRAQAGELHLHVPDATVEKIARGVIAELEARQYFKEPPEPEPPAPPADDGSGAQDAPGTEPPPAPRRTLADRMLGL